MIATLTHVFGPSLFLILLFMTWVELHAAFRRRRRWRLDSTASQSEPADPTAPAGDPSGPSPAGPPAPAAAGSADRTLG